MRSASNIPFVAVVPGSVMATQSACGKYSSSLSVWMSSSTKPGLSVPVRRTPITLAPSAFARFANSPPMSPRPSTSTVEFHAERTCPRSHHLPVRCTSRYKCSFFKSSNHTATMYSEIARPYAPVAFVKTVSFGRQPWIYPSTPALSVCNHLSLSPVEMSFGLTLPRIISAFCTSSRSALPSL